MSNNKRRKIKGNNLKKSKVKSIKIVRILSLKY